MTVAATVSGGRPTPRSWLRYRAHSPVLMPMIRCCAPGAHRPPCSATTCRRTCSHTGSESTITPSRSNTTASIMHQPCLPLGYTSSPIMPPARPAGPVCPARPAAPRGPGNDGGPTRLRQPLASAAALCTMAVGPVRPAAAGTPVRASGEIRHMSESLSLGTVGAAARRDRTHALFGQTMGYVAVTTGFFALGAYLGRHLSAGWAIVWYIVGFACLIAMNFTVRRSQGLSVVLLLAVGTTLGLALAPTLVYYATVNPQVLWQAGGATALFIAGFGAAGYATRRDLSGLARLCFWALIALIVFGIVLIFVQIPAGDLIYSILGLVIFAGLTMFDFQRLRRSKDINSAPLLAASIFLDALNVFLFFLRIFSRGSN